MLPATVLPADQLFGSDLSGYGRRLLAEGDSWFTLGGLNLPQTSNLLLGLRFAQQHVIVSCAYPGETLRQMAQASHDRTFDRVLRQPRHARYWDAILLSAGGNDLIDAVQHRALHADGRPAALDERLLLTPAEAAVVQPGRQGAERYVSEPGWAALAAYLQGDLASLVQRRDEGPSRGRPLILHSYSVPVVRPSGNLKAPEGWLYPALRDYGIPVAERQALAALLFERLRQLWLHAAATLPQVHLFDSATQVALEPAQPDATGNSGDWVNEIHPNTRGYDRIGQVMGPWIEALLAQYP